MALTDHCDVFGSAHERGLNRIAGHLMRQRPSLFNYGTEMFARTPSLLCKPIDSHPEVTRRGNPLITIEDPLPILGTDGMLGLNFCVQFTELRLDLYPTNQFSLPTELGDRLPLQALALRAMVCGAIACPDPRDAQRIGDSFDYPPIRLPGQKGENYEGKPRERAPISAIPSRGELECFCLDLYAVAGVEMVDGAHDKELAVGLHGVEIAEIRPEELENNLECYIATTLRVGVLPRIRISLDTMIFELGKYATLTIDPTPTGGAVRHNPAIEDDQIKVFVNVGVT